MESKNITLRVNSELYGKYRELCKKKGFKKEEELDLQGFQIYKFVLKLT